MSAPVSFPDIKPRGVMMEMDSFVQGSRLQQDYDDALMRYMSALQMAYSQLREAATLGPSRHGSNLGITAHRITAEEFTIHTLRSLS